MAKGKKQSASSMRWHGGLGKRRKDARVKKSSHGKFNSVAELEAHRVACQGDKSLSKRHQRRKVRQGE